MIDNDTGSMYNTTFPHPDESDPSIEQAYKQWYTSPALEPSSNHTIFISDTHDVAVDFALVTLTDPDVPLNVDSGLDPTGSSSGRRTRQILVDDQDPEIRYEGNWASTTDSKYLALSPFPGGYPIGNSTHQSKKAGDCLEFRFFGEPLPHTL